MSASAARRLRPGFAGCAFALLLGAGLLLPGCGPRTLAEVPADLIGVWKTDSGPHAKSFLEIRSEELVLGLAGIPFDVLPIDAIDVQRDPQGNFVYRFHYTADEGYADVLVVTRVASSRPEIRVGSRAEPWVRGLTR